MAKPSWVLDLDMFTTESLPFTSEGLLTTATSFAEYLYWLFREMVTEEFLTFLRRRVHDRDRATRSAGHAHFCGRLHVIALTWRPPSHS